MHFIHLLAVYKYLHQFCQAILCLSSALALGCVRGRPLFIFEVGNNLSLEMRIMGAGEFLIILSQTQRKEQLLKLGFTLP